MIGEISAVTLAQFEGGESGRVIIVGTTYSEVLMCEIEDLFHVHLPFRWAPVELSPCITSGTVEVSWTPILHLEATVTCEN
jgi:hypothetical protein